MRIMFSRKIVKFSSIEEKVTNRSESEFIHESSEFWETLNLWFLTHLHIALN